MVPGSTLMYGSSFIIVTRRPRASRMAAREAAAMPLPREDTTPPVTKTREGVDPVGVMVAKGLENGILPGVHRGVLVPARNRPPARALRLRETGTPGGHGIPART